MSSIIKYIDPETGREQEFEPTYGMDGTHRLEINGIVPFRPDVNYEMPTLRLIRKRHNFSGAVFEETGEKRRAVAGDWTLTSTNGPWFWQEPSVNKLTILCPVPVEES